MIVDDLIIFLMFNNHIIYKSNYSTKFISHEGRKFQISLK
jgi:hypothetical protein